MAVKNHTHKYILKNLGTKQKPRKVYACGFPDCTHFMPQKALVIGKKSICNRCNAEFVITKELVDKDRVRPACLKCRRLFHKKEEEKVEQVTLDSALDKLLNGMRGE